MTPTKRIARRSAAKGLTAFSSLIMTLCRPQSLPTNPISSIHAPARGATASCRRSLRRPPSFNPRTREGCDLVSRPLAALGHVSIHAPARGATRRPAPPTAPPRRFNPRTREGCDYCRPSCFRRSGCLGTSTYLTSWRLAPC